MGSLVKLRGRVEKLIVVRKELDNDGNNDLTYA